MSEPEQWVGLEDVPSIADESWLYGPETNGTAPIDEDEDSWLPQNLAELDDTPPVQPTLGGLGIVYPGKRHVFSGPQESAKTLAAYVIGLQVVRAGQRVVLIDFEMGPWDAKTRLKELGATDGELHMVLYVDPSTPASPQATGRLVERQPHLVIVDAVAGAFDLEGYDDNSRKDVEKWATKWVIPFWKAGIATIVLDHVTKNVDTRGSYAIGSERKVGGADVHLGFEVVTPIKRGGHGLYKIVTHKDRGGFLKRGKLAEFELTSDPDSHAISWAFKAPVETDEEHAFRPTHLMEKVSRHLEQQYGPIPLGHLERDVIGKAEFIRQAITILCDEGYVSESEGARNARLLISEMAYRESTDDLVPTSSHLVPEFAEPTSSHPSPPSRGDEDADGDDGTGTTSSRRSLEDDDGIPF